MLLVHSGGTANKHGSMISSQSRHVGFPSRIEGVSQTGNIDFKIKAIFYAVNNGICAYKGLKTFRSIQ
jgi:hypothetical protein